MLFTNKQRHYVAVLLLLSARFYIIQSFLYLCISPLSQISLEQSNDSIFPSTLCDYSGMIAMKLNNEYTIDNSPFTCTINYVVYNIVAFLKIQLITIDRVLYFIHYKVFPSGQL